MKSRFFTFRSICFFLASYVLAFSTSADPREQTPSIESKRNPNVQTVNPYKINRLKKLEEELKTENSESNEKAEETQSEMFLKAYELHKNKKYTAALKAYKKTTAKEPKNALIWNNIGLIRVQQKNYKLAEEAYKKSLEINAEELQTINNLADLYLQQGKTIDAKLLYKQAIEIDPDYPYSYSNLANLYKNFGEYFTAIEFYKKAIDKAPTAEFYYRLGLAYFDMKRYEDMLESFHQAIGLEPEYTEALYSLCIVHFYNLLDYSPEKRKRSFQKAFEELKKLDSELSGKLSETLSQKQASTQEKKTETI